MYGPTFRPFSSTGVLVFSEPEPPVPVDGVDEYTSPAASATGAPFSSGAAWASGSYSYFSLISCYNLCSSKLYSFFVVLMGVRSSRLSTVGLLAPAAVVPNALDRWQTK